MHSFHLIKPLSGGVSSRPLGFLSWLNQCSGWGTEADVGMLGHLLEICEPEGSKGQLLRQGQPEGSVSKEKEESMNRDCGTKQTPGDRHQSLETFW